MPPKRLSRFSYMNKALLNSDLSSFEIREQLEENHITTQDIEEKILDISKKLTDIDKHQIEADKRAATEDSLLLQGWDETTAEIASYASKDFEIGTNTEIQNKIKEDIKVLFFIFITS